MTPSDLINTLVIAGQSANEASLNVEAVLKTLEKDTPVHRIFWAENKIPFPQSGMKLLELLITNLNHKMQSDWNQIIAKLIDYGPAYSTFFTLFEALRAKAPKDIIHTDIPLKNVHFQAEEETLLSAITFENFKSYSNASLPLAHLTVLIGANASGKSNALEAFHLLSWLAGGQKISVLYSLMGDSEKFLRGKITDYFYKQGTFFSLGCKLSIGKWNDFRIVLTVRSDELHITFESITSPDEKFPLYQVEQSSFGLSYDIRVAYNNFARGGKKPKVTCTDQIPVMCQLESSALFEAGHKKAQKEIPETVRIFQKLLTSILFLDPVPALMRGDSDPSKKLHGDGSNLSGVLYDLWEQKGKRSDILAFIQSLPEQDIKDIRFFKDRRGQVALELVESFGGEERTWPVELLSDGTLRVLAIAAALLSAPEGSTVVIEEVDNGVHPSRAKHLMHTMREQAQARNLRLLLSTHNPALMDALPDEALGDVVFCYRDPAKGDSRLVKLSNLQDYPGLLLQGHLGQLVTAGVVDRFVKSPVTSEEKKKKALEWLAQLQGVES